MPMRSYSTLIKSKKLFHNLQEIDSTLTEATRQALNNTLDDMKEELQKIIKEDVYDNVYINNKRGTFDRNSHYKSEWGGRTESLLDDKSIETYIYNAFGKGLGAGIRFNDQPYYNNTNLKNYQHGNKYFGELAFTSYLEMLNNSMLLLKENPFGFPTGNELRRDSFWRDFKKWVDENFERKFQLYLKLALGEKPSASSSNFNRSSSMNLSSSTSNIPSLNTGSLSESKKDNSFHGTITVTDANGINISTTEY